MQEKKAFSQAFPPFSQKLSEALDSLGSEVVCCQPGIVDLQDNVGIFNSCRKNLMGDK